jgi:hypothetical protein
MQVQVGKIKIEISGGSTYIKAFRKEIFIKMEVGVSFKPYMRRDAVSGSREIWAGGIYAIVSPQLN